jgi:long-subunit acyl-CoA synthetase (AMP-forming)
MPEIEVRHTMCAVFQDTVAARGDAVALRTKGDGTRLTWREYGERVRRLAGGFAGLGVRAGDAVGILMINRPEFNVVDVAVMHLGAIPFSMYLTSPAEQLEYFVRDSGARVLVTERAQLARVKALRLPIETIVCVDEGAAGDGVLSLEQVEARAPAGFDFEASWRSIRPESVLTLIYTSGTTGDPKGVELTHANMIAECRAFLQMRPLEESARIISYLPHAHAADRFGTHYMAMTVGAEVTACPDPRLLMEHVMEVRPTQFTGVPRVWEKLKAAIEAKFALDEGKRAAFAGALEAALTKVRLEQAGQPVPEPLSTGVARAEQMMFAPLRAALGLGEARTFFVGAAPSTRDVLEFFHALGMPICEVWGMSELSCCATVMPVGRTRIGTVGVAMPGVELRVAEDGELLVRGPIVMRGYRNKPEQTRESIVDGWMHTGDVAEIDADGYVRIVDRKKELIINAAGKNMSPANIEARVKASSPLIGQAVVVGDRRPYNVALLVLDPDGAMAFCRARGIDMPLAALVEHEAVRAEVARAIDAANARLSRVEHVKRYTLLAAEWLPAGDELTPTMKLKRKAIAAKYADSIAAMYVD